MSNKLKNFLWEEFKTGPGKGGGLVIDYYKYLLQDNN